jgi:uncharacterized membrane protein
MTAAGVVLMIGICVSAVALLIAGVALGALAVVSLGIRREERDLSLTSDTTDRAVRGARRLTGLYTRGPGVIEQVRQYRQNT